MRESDCLEAGVSYTIDLKNWAVVLWFLFINDRLTLLMLKHRLQPPASTMAMANRLAKQELGGAACPCLWAPLYTVDI